MIDGETFITLFATATLIFAMAYFYKITQQE